MVEYLLIINMIAFAMMGIDKWKAKNKKWRIPEKQLMLIAILGGASGSIIGMQWFRHKTKKTKFNLGLPLLLMIQILIYGWIR